MTRPLHVRALSFLRRRYSSVRHRLAPLHDKEREEMGHWTSRRAIEGRLANAHYVPFYTTHFGLTLEFYRGKRILDIGCGPRGSLEWAEDAAERVGLDPLANEYIAKGFTAHHQMRYVDAFSERIPFPDAHFDVVCSFNSLDHVVSVERTIAEIERVTRPGGLFLLLVEVGHPPTVMEPHTLRFDLARSLEPAFAIERERHYERSAETGMYDSIDRAVAYDHADPSPRTGILSVKAVRAASR